MFYDIKKDRGQNEDKTGGCPAELLYPIKYESWSSVCVSVCLFVTSRSGIFVMCYIDKDEIC